MHAYFVKYIKKSNLHQIRWVENRKENASFANVELSFNVKYANNFLPELNALWEKKSSSSFFYNWTIQGVSKQEMKQSETSSCNTLNKEPSCSFIIRANLYNGIYSDRDTNKGI